MKKIVFLIFLLSIILTFPCGIILADSEERITAQYVKTSDGDTARFIVEGENVRVRFLGINTPEVSGENKVEEPYGQEALLYTQNILEHAKKIEIEFDDVANKEDRFGRKLAWIWVDDELLEVKILQQGLAKTYMLKNNYRYAKELKEAEKEAKNEKAGLWNDTKQEEKKTNPNHVGKNEEIFQKPTYENDEETNRIMVYAIIFVILVIIIATLKNRRAK